MRRIVDPWANNTTVPRYYADGTPNNPIPTDSPLNAPIGEPTLRERLFNVLYGWDDAIQGYGRSTYSDMADAFGDSMGGVPRNVANTVGDFVHRDRQQFEDDVVGRGSLYATRALQAGGLTAAGVGLANLTNQMIHSFGGEKDEPGIGVMPMY